MGPCIETAVSCLPIGASTAEFNAADQPSLSASMSEGDKPSGATTSLNTDAAALAAAAAVSWFRSKTRMRSSENWICALSAGLSWLVEADSEEGVVDRGASVGEKLGEHTKELEGAGVLVERVKSYRFGKGIRPYGFCRSCPT